jgi:hypothetical protein
MGKVRNPSRQATGDDRRIWRVVDDFPCEVPVGPAELDAVEAFLMPLVNAILSGTPYGTDAVTTLVSPALDRAVDSKEPQKSGKQGR